MHKTHKMFNIIIHINLPGWEFQDHTIAYTERLNLGKLYTTGFKSSGQTFPYSEFKQRDTRFTHLFYF